MKRSIIIFIITVLWFGSFSFMGIDLHHDGVMLIPAARVAENAIVFRDVFCQYGLLSPLLQGLWLKIFGVEVFALKLLTVLFYGGSAIILDKISRSMTGRFFNWLPIIMFWLLMPDTMVTTHAWSSVFALFFSLAALWMVQCSFAGGTASKVWLAAAGAAVGLTFMARHPSGFFAACAIGIALTVQAFSGKDKAGRVKNFWRYTLWCGGGFFAVVLLGALYLLGSGAWDDYILQCFTYVANFAWKRGGSGDWTLFCSTLFPFVSNDIGFYNIIFAVLPLCALWLLYYSSRLISGHGECEADRARRYSLFALALMALGCWPQYYPVPCVRHLYWAAVPAFAVFAFVIEKLCHVDGEKRMLCRISAIVLIFCAVYCSAPRMLGAFQRLRYVNLRFFINSPGIRGIGLTGREAYFITTLTDTVKKLPESMRKRGVINLSEGAALTVLLPDSGFRHPQFLRIIPPVYPDYPDKTAEFISKHRPLILSDDENAFYPDYQEIWQGENMGVVYRLFAPESGRDER